MRNLLLALGMCGLIFSSAVPAMANDDLLASLKKAEESADAAAMVEVGWLFNKAGDAKKAIKAWEKAEKVKADGAGNFAIGLAYLTGEDAVPFDEGKAFEYIQKATLAGNTDAYFYLGMLYKDGRGVQQDDAKAIEAYTVAADKGNEAACLDLAYLYANASPKDMAKAIKYYEKAAETVGSARVDLGTIYLEGNGVAKDPAQALMYFEWAAQEGNPWGAYYAGTIYADADKNGLPISADKCGPLFEQAAMGGLPEGAMGLAAFYETLAADQAEFWVDVYKWYAIAEKLLSPDAAEKKAKTAAAHPEAVEPGEKAAQEWYDMYEAAMMGDEENMG